ncbi:p115 like vesicle tethering protein, partial [Sporodiniella umbellata]
GDRGQPQSVDETIDKLADCLETATLLEDKRAAVLSLKGLARDWPEEVGNKSFPGLIKVLHLDHVDVETQKSLLDTIAILCTVQNQYDRDEGGYKFTDYFIEDSNNVTVLVDILEEFDFYVRYNTLKLLSTLLTNRTKRIQECILTNPMGVSRLVDLLDDKREIIRNEGLLLLIALTRSNTEIQKIVTFQATFEKLLSVIEEQEGISGDIVVQDSLTLMHNLLRYNVSDQIYFRETSCIQQIPGLLGYVGDSEADHVPYSFEDWPSQKVANTVLILQLIRILTEPDSSSTPMNQTVMVQSGILLPIVQLALCSNAPSLVRTEALYAIASVVSEHTQNQHNFAQIAVASPPALGKDGQLIPNAVSGLPRPTIVSLISIAIMEDADIKYSYSSRAAATHAIYCCLSKNEDIQLVLASTLKSSPPQDNINSSLAGKPHSAGSLLLEAIDNWEQSLSDPYIVWFACDILSHIVGNSEKAKEVVNSIVFGDESKGEDPVPFLHHVVAQLLMATKNPSTNSRIPIGYLTFLSIWLYDSPLSVSLFLAESTNVQFLMQEMLSSTNDPMVQGLVAYLLGIIYKCNDDTNTPLDRKNLKAIYSSRSDQMNSLLSRLRDSPSVKNASQYLQITPEEEPNGSLPSLLLDGIFVDFFKSNCEIIQKALKKKPADFSKPKNVSTPVSLVVPDEAVQSYKTTIDEQANLLKSLEQKASEYALSVESLKLENDKLKNSLVSYEKDNTLLKQKISELEAQDQSSKIVDLEKILAEQKDKFVELEKEQEDVLVLMGDQDLQLKKYRKKLRELDQVVSDSEEE